ncbi:hypothetical protein E2986_08863 [Frieseomelitta varia]|uniref:Glycosyltransferase family 92 protein n=1 Tax=Frieseomelitta varia TaxID=561572 RepID=A0A833WCW1_9HYME|nr:uncharacterized protein LOC122527981 [Frieseomelitta varia]XP_043508557.1 uncharacterized protein LOC122527981 [Frieseomelitta varia]XP_043508558.1 uncharacterized protein LOC122527981 [Frieseomelitta varia]XP_043508559.1 uncharacterized protein LOC122527981 [Frieseomelitta varia]XP_043508560.1 uncharacterized protein LOC122527981 [Frieseomelitta varia]KAF3427963.1 hypothetical protein E2986_08863 [Frieseomelitta varia]
MRKYYQAALVIIAIVSLVSLLFYRHEYNKLRYVLEVFNYFGKPNQRSEMNCTNNVPVFTKFDMKFEEPLSAWQRLDDDLYVYSAYNIRDKEIQVIGFGSSNSIKDMQCQILFENEIEPVLGSFNYLSINSNNLNSTSTGRNIDYRGYHFYCTYTKNKIPIGIMFLTKSNSDLQNIPILPIKNQSHNLNYVNIGVCITPSLTKPIQPLQMISFIQFHDIIGVDNFIVYDFGIPSQYNSNFKELSKSPNPYWKFTYTIVPWNFPFLNTHPTIIKDLIQADCLYRTYNKVMYITTLSWEEYIVLRYHHSLTDLMTDFKKSKMKADRYKLKTLTFCTQQTDSVSNKNVTLMIFRKLHYDTSIPDNQPIYIYNTHEVFKKNIYTRDIGKDLVILNRYQYCPGKSNIETGTEDTTILRFTEDVQSSQIYRKFITENKFLLNSSN